MQGLRVAVQGFGNVGAYFAKFIAEQGATVVAISDSSGGIYNPNGLDVAAAFAHKRGGGSLSELKGGEHDHERRADRARLRRLCAVRARAGRHRRERRPGEGARVVEGANGPLTPAADEILEGNGVLVLPDVLANAGGVVVSYFEWVQGLQEYFWKEDEVNARLNDDHHARVRRDVGDVRERARRRCGWRPTGSPCSASPRRPSRAGSIPSVASSTGRGAASASGRASSSTGWALPTTPSTSPATTRSRRGIASGCRWWRSTASGRSSTTSTKLPCCGSCADEQFGRRV